MIKFIVHLVEYAVRRPWQMVVVALAIAVGCGVYAARNFAIKTDINALISPDLPWAQRGLRYLKDFPQGGIVVVLDAPSAELADQGAAELAEALQKQPALFRHVSLPGGGPFFAENGLLYLPTDEVDRLTDELGRADALIETLAGDPSLRGSLEALSLGLLGVKIGRVKLDDMVRPLTMAADVVAAVLGGRRAFFSWRELASGKPAEPQDLQRFLTIDPVLNFSALQPGRDATNAIKQAASHLDLAQDDVQLRLTGRVPMEDDDFATITQNAGRNLSLMLGAVLIILWLALRSWRIIFAVAASVAVGLAVSTATGLLLVGAFNVISVAFFVLFIGLGIDFSIQFSVRYRAERHDIDDLKLALTSAARKAGAPLALATAATAVGFSAFLPTSYLGLSELGQIAGTGMVIAFVVCITLLPALLAILKPAGELHAVGFAWLAPVDRLLERHRVAVVATTVAVVVAASPLLLFLPFDFDPNHLRNQDEESVAAYLALRRNPQVGANAIDVVARDLAATDAIARRLSALPQVAEVRTLKNLIPQDQEEKLSFVREAAAKIEPSLNPEALAPPSDAENVAKLTSTADRLTMAAGNDQGPGAEAARRLAGLLTQLAKARPSERQAVETAVVSPLRYSLDQLRGELNAKAVSEQTLPSDLTKEWVTADGHARIEVLPKGDPDDTATLRDFVTAVLAVEPDATGPAVMLYEAADTVVRAFIEAGIFALAAIALLLFIALRRIGDVLLTLVPLIVAGVVTLELCVVLDLPLNFADIIALPLLLGVGVAFKIYYIWAWRAGKTALLQSSLTRAVVFSAMTTATAFGSLWLSEHPGTSSMGKLMALSLVCTMAAAVLFQPALMGPPREGREAADL